MEEMEEKRCEITELYESQCAHCQGHDQPEPKTERRPGWITARYVGRCSSCRREIESGEQIRRDDEDLGWVCEDCG